jgi:hypothetical protein
MMEVDYLVIFGSHKRSVRNYKIWMENIKGTSGGILEHPSPLREMRQLLHNIACQGRWKMGKVWQ